MAKVVAVHKDDEGKLEFFLLDDGRVISLHTCVEMVYSNELEGLVVGKTIYGDDTIHAKRDYDTSNNLSNLPEF